MRRVWLAAFLCWGVSSALACFCYPLFLFDAAERYAPMADAFARGDFASAFHPRFGVIFPVLAGTLSALTGLPGSRTVQVAAFLALSLAGVVMFAFARRLSDSEEVAGWTFALTLLAPDLFRYALDGLREPLAGLVFALVGYGLAASAPWAFGIALFLYAATFAVGFAAGGALLILWIVFRLRSGGFRDLLSPILGWLLGSACVTVLTHAHTGHWLPSPQYVALFGRWL